MKCYGTRKIGLVALTQLPLILLAEIPLAMIGTSGLGHVSPAATSPFGLVQAGPDTSAQEDSFSVDWKHTSGYQHEDDWIWRFSQTHLSGTGCASFGDFGILPIVEGFDALTHPAKILHATEIVEPGSYAVSFTEGNAQLSAEVVALPHTAIYSFTYPQGEKAKLLIDLDWGIGGEYHCCWGKFVKGTKFSWSDDCRKVFGSRAVVNWTNYQLHFAASFSRPFCSPPVCRQKAGDGHGEIWELDFGELKDGVLSVSLGLSYTSAHAAERNRAAEADTFDLATARARVAAEWAKALSVIELDSSTDASTQLNFRAALYRTYFQPNLISDVGAKPRYSTFSFWDTFRAAHPLYTFTAAERVPDFVNSMLDLYDRQGYLPIWGLAGLDTHCMVGHHAVPVIVDAYLKGLGGAKGEVDWERAYRAIKDSLTEEHQPSNAGGWGLLKEDWDLLNRYGYYPFDQMRGNSEGLAVKGESVARLLECAYDDACAARLAKGLGKLEDVAFFVNRSKCWTNVYDRMTGFMRGKDSAGKWREPFSPYALGHNSWQDNDYCEGNAWQYTWHVLHDFNGLFTMMGGRSVAQAKLDGLFAARPPEADRDGEENNVTGLIGQYAHGNEQSHHIAYLYTLLGAPEKTAKVVRKVFATQYFPRPDGLSGNDDCGQMAAWYVFSALGFYPVDPCGGEYVIGAPQVASAKMRLPNGKSLTIRAEGGAARGVREVWLNGRRLDTFILHHSDLLAGGELIFR